MASFGAYAKKNGIKYFLISFVDLFGTMRAKVVPATAIDKVAKAGAGFAGFAVWFDMTPAHADILVMADLETAIQLPWKPEVAWVTGDLMMDGKPVTQNPRQVLKRGAAPRFVKLEVPEWVRQTVHLAEVNASSFNIAAGPRRITSRPRAGSRCFSPC